MGGGVWENVRRLKAKVVQEQGLVTNLGLEPDGQQPFPTIDRTGRGLFA
jgi:hypothetical protein